MKRRLSSSAVMLLLALLAVPGSAHPETRVSDSAIILPADTQPEFKADPWGEGGGNQISGVVRVMREDSRGWLWFGTQDGLARYDGNQLVYFDLRNAHGRGVVVRSIAEDAQGQLWFGTSDGVTSYDGEFFTTWGIPDGLGSADVWGIFVDRRGAIWIGTLDGAWRFDGETFTAFPLPEGRKNPNRGVSSPTMVTSITEDRSGNLWFTIGGCVRKYDGQTIESIQVMEDESTTHVTGILEDHRGHIWFGTDEKGVIRYDGEVFTNVTEQYGLHGLEVNGLFEDSRGDVWFTGEGHGVFRYDGTDLIMVSGDPELGTHAVFHITEDSRGRMWFSGFGGVWLYDGRSVVNVTRDGPW